MEGIVEFFNFAKGLSDSRLIVGSCVVVFLLWLSSLLGTQLRRISQIAFGIALIGFLSWKSLLLLLFLSGFVWLIVSRFYLNKLLLRIAGWGIVWSLLIGKFICSHFLGKTGLLNAEFLGVSFYSFRLVACCFDTARERKSPCEGLEFFHWSVFPATFLAGPIQRLNEFNDEKGQLINRTVEGLERIAKGIVFKLFIADSILSLLFDGALNGVLDGKGVFGLNDNLCAWLIGPLSFLKTYFDFMGLTHLAIGVGLLMGVRVPENFKLPLLAADLTKFWQQWHMTLSRWCIDYIFTPVLLLFRSKILAVMICFLFIGVWHDVSMKWALWGVLHGIGVCVAGWARSKRFLEKRGLFGRILGTVITVSFVMLVFVVVCGVEMNDVLLIYGKMFGLR